MKDSCIQSPVKKQLCYGILSWNSRFFNSSHSFKLFQNLKNKPIVLFHVHWKLDHPPHYLRSASCIRKFVILWTNFSNVLLTILPTVSEGGKIILRKICQQATKNDIFLIILNTLYILQKFWCISIHSYAVFVEINKLFHFKTVIVKCVIWKTDWKSRLKRFKNVCRFIIEHSVSFRCTIKFPTKKTRNAS